MLLDSSPSSYAYSMGCAPSLRKLTGTGFVIGCSRFRQLWPFSHRRLEAVEKLAKGATVHGLHGNKLTEYGTEMAKD